MSGHVQCQVRAIVLGRYKNPHHLVREVKVEVVFRNEDGEWEGTGERYYMKNEWEKRNFRTRLQPGQIVKINVDE